MLASVQIALRGIALLPWVWLVSATPVAALAESSDRLSSQLRRVGERRIYFGHQSVGANVLDGLRDLAREAGVSLLIKEETRDDSLEGPAILEAAIGRNTDPTSKIDAFAKSLDTGAAGRSEIAFFKFCYVDFDSRSDVDAIFQQYVRMHEKAKASHPGVSLVHVTVPLTVTQGGVKGYVKNVLGRVPNGELENVVRHRFNELLRARYGGKEPIFDLARIESTYDDGRTESFERDGSTYPKLVSAYTDDGEHLNVRGRRRVARELVSLLVSLP